MFKVGVQGVNLLDETTKTFQVLNDDLLLAPRSWFKNDRRFSFVVRAPSVSYNHLTLPTD